MKHLPWIATALLGSVMVAAIAQPAAPAPGAPPARPVTETFFGTAVPDPYRWLEDFKAPEAAQWMKAQAEHTTAQLARIPGRQRLFDELQRYDSAASARVTGVKRETGGLWFYQRRGATENQFKLYARQGLDGAEKLLVDPEAAQRETGKPHAINYAVPSPGGKFMAYGMSAQGSEDAVLHLIEVASGKPVGQPIDRLRFGGVAWTPDGRQFAFNRLQEMKPGMAPTERFLNVRSFLAEPGSDLQQAKSVFGIDTPGVEMAPAEFPYLGFSADGRWALGFVINGTQREIGLYVAPAAGVREGRPAWRRLLHARDAVTRLDYHDGQLYLLSHQGAPRFQLLRLAIEAPDISRAEVLLPQSARVLTGIAAAADALYLELRDGNVKKLFKRAHAPKAEFSEVALPVAGAFELGFGGDPRLPGVVIDLQGWTRARQVFQVHADGRVTNTGLQPQGPYDAPADVATTEVMVRSHDGAMVPMSIVHRRGVRLDGRNPTVLYGYASYGSTEEPFFSTSRLAWLDAGGVFAIANPRGSSVSGQDWYKAGFQASKPNTWRDFIACAEWLVAQKWTSPDRLGILGGSAGGILVGRAMTERPDLFAAVVPAVGVLDMLRAELTPNGVPNIPEFGTRTTEPGFRSLLAMSTYHQIKDGVRYPAVLLTHGVNDGRVDVWHSTKTAARLLAANPGGKPVLLRLDYDSGHGVGDTRQQRLQQSADIYSFFAWQMGVEGFQPK